MTLHPRHLVGPDDDAAAIAAVARVCVHLDVGADKGARSVGNSRIGALVIAADAHLATAGFAGGVDLRRPEQRDAATEHVDRSSVAAGRTGIEFSVHQRVATGTQHQPAALEAGGLRLGQTAVPQLAGKHSDRVTFQCAEIECLVRGGGEVEVDAFQAAPGDRYLAAGRQDGVAADGLDHAGVAHCDGRGDQHHVAAARDDLAADLQRRAVHSVATEDQPAGERVGIAHAKGGRGEARRIDDGACSHRDAGRVDQHQPAVGTERTEDGAGIRSQHAVDRGAGAAWLREPRAGAGCNAKALPVDCGVVGAGAVLRGHSQPRPALRQGGAADDRLRAGRLGAGRRQ